MDRRSPTWSVGNGDWRSRRPHVHEQLGVALLAASTTIGPTTVYQSPEPLIWSLSPTRMFQNHEVGSFSGPRCRVDHDLLDHQHVADRAVAGANG